MFESVEAFFQALPWCIIVVLLIKIMMQKQKIERITRKKFLAGRILK